MAATHCARADRNWSAFWSMSDLIYGLSGLQLAVAVGVQILGNAAQAALAIAVD
jgi:hypothetical protein